MIIAKKTGKSQPAPLLKWEKGLQPAPPKAPRKDTDPVVPVKSAK